MAGSNPAQPVGDLVGMRDSLEELKAELVGAPGLQHGLQCVSSHFGAVRRVAGDGNCFYRSAPLVACAFVFDFQLLYSELFSLHMLKLSPSAWPPETLPGRRSGPG